MGESIATSQLLINSESYDESTGTFILKFGQQQRFQKTQIALPKISIYHSFANISEKLGNNYLSLFFPDGTGHTEFKLTIADGHYTQATFYTWLKEKMDERYLYVLQNDVKFYPIFMAENNSYKRLLVFYNVSSTAVQDNLATWALPISGSVLSPYIVWPESLGALFGHKGTQQGSGIGNELVKSTLVAENSINSIILSCNLLNNSQISSPSNILASFAVGATSFGSIINAVSPKLGFMDVTEGFYNELIISFQDQNLNKIKLLDTNVLILLSFKQKP